MGCRFPPPVTFSRVMLTCWDYSLDKHVRMNGRLILLYWPFVVDDAAFMPSRNIRTTHENGAVADAGLPSRARVEIRPLRSLSMTVSLAPAVFFFPCCSC